MYEKHWHLTRKPFENTPDPAFLYHSSQHEEALARLNYVVKERKGAGLLTGVFGCGKTLLGYTLLRELPADRYKVTFIANPFFSHVELLMSIVTHLGTVDLPNKKSEVLTNVLMDSLNAILNTNMQEGKDTVIIIDECHIIEDPLVFEELRLLLNFQAEDRFLLTLLLFGQPELRQKIDNNKQFEQRIAIKCHLDNLSPQDSAGYIDHRLKVTGRDKSIFSDGALELIHERTGGIPRRINRLCDICLLAGFAKHIKQIDEAIVLEECRGLEANF
jgi:type II secretory pathway predicted ATPase ExeA